MPGHQWMATAHLGTRPLSWPQGSRSTRLPCSLRTTTICKDTAERQLKTSEAAKTADGFSAEAQLCISSCNCQCVCVCVCVCVSPLLHPSAVPPPIYPEGTAHTIMLPPSTMKALSPTIKPSPSTVPPLFTTRALTPSTMAPTTHRGDVASRSPAAGHDTGCRHIRLASRVPHAVLVRQPKPHGGGRSQLPERVCIPAAPHRSSITLSGVQPVHSYKQETLVHCFLNCLAVLVAVDWL